MWSTIIPANGRLVDYEFPLSTAGFVGLVPSTEVPALWYTDRVVHCEYGPAEEPTELLIHTEQTNDAQVSRAKVCTLISRAKTRLERKAPKQTATR